MSIQVLRGPSVSTDNPVLAEGQPYVDIESNPPKLKIGDGTTGLNNLPYIGAEFASDVYRNDGIYPTRTPFTIATADIPVFSLDTKQIHVDTIYSESRDTIHLMNSILPTDTTVNLGDASTRFNYIYGENIYGNSFIGTSASITQVDGQNAAFSGEVNTPVCKVTTLDSNTGGNIIVGKGLIPSNDNYYTLGSANKEWTKLYVGEIHCNSRITVTGQNYPHFYASDNTCTIGKDTSNQLCISGGVIRPGGNGAQNLGNGAHRWATIYAVTGSINTSDKNEKKDIQELDEQYSKDIIMRLKPVSYKFIANDSNRTHNGFIAQDIEESLTSMGLTTQDFAAVCKWQKVYCEDGVNDTPIEGEYSYGLRYEELIAPLVKVVQQQQHEIDILKTQLKLITEE